MLSDKMKRLKERLGSYRFWFSYKLPADAIRSPMWPISSKGDEENLLVVQSPSWYNLYFDDLTKKQKFTEKDFADELVCMFANGRFNTQCSSAPYFKKAASLVSNGFTSSTMLGKLRATELHLHAEKNRLYSLRELKKERLYTWLGHENQVDFDEVASICLNEHVCTPSEFATLLKFEMLVRNPLLIQQEVNGKDIFDYDFKAMYGPSNIAGLNPLKNCATVLTDNAFEGILGELTTSLGIKFSANPKMNLGSVAMYPVKRFAATRQAIRNFKNRLLRRKPDTISK